MQTLELNKIVGALLTAGVIASFSGFVAEIAFEREHPETPAYTVTAGEAEAGGATEAEAALEDVAPLLAEASVEAGTLVAKKCLACHSFDQGGANKIGPALWDVVNRAVASGEGFAYSSALKGRSGEAWSYANLNAFLAKPKDWAPGTKMGFAGLPKTADRADLILYLRSLSGTPAALP